MTRELLDRLGWRTLHREVRAEGVAGRSPVPPDLIVDQFSSRSVEKHIW